MSIFQQAGGLFEGADWKEQLGVGRKLTWRKEMRADTFAQNRLKECFKELYFFGNYCEWEKLKKSQFYIHEN